MKRISAGPSGDDATYYYVPPTTSLRESSQYAFSSVAPPTTVIAFDKRVIRINDPTCHAEFPSAHSRRMIAKCASAVVEGVLSGDGTSSANRFAATSAVREYVGEYRYILRRPAHVPDQRSGACYRRPIIWARSAR